LPRTMIRGKQQVLLNNLPNRTFDFERVAAIARVISIRGNQRNDLNVSILLRKISEEVRPWHEDYRPALRDDILQHSERFVLIDPTSVQSELFPKVLWCQNHACGRVFDYRYQEQLPTECPSCQGPLIQLRFVKIHRCGALHPLLPPSCPQCHTASNMALEKRESERIRGFRWVCRTCNQGVELHAGSCTECKWPVPTLQSMDIEVHRAGRVFYPHTTVLLNIPNRTYDGFFGLKEWPAIAAAKLFGFPETRGRALIDYASGLISSNSQPVGISGAQLADLLKRQSDGELTPEQIVMELRAIRERNEQKRSDSSSEELVQALIKRTGVSWPIWQGSGQEMVEALIPQETGNIRELEATAPSVQLARNLGISRIALISDFPIITATYGYSRADYLPNKCRLNPFPADQTNGGRFPIFVDQVQADALLISLDHNRVLSWLEQNNCIPDIPSGNSPDLARKAYFVELFNGIQFRETLHRDNREARMVFGLLHTLSHISVRQAALFCGLDRTSLSEHLFPRTLSFALYCNHRFGATIGALTALFEQSLVEWLTALRETRRCVYDPVCRDRAGSCHACTHLAETSCRFFNLNLSRSFLFGGHDEELGRIEVGYLDPSLP